MLDKKQRTTDLYNKGAKFFAEKFNSFGIRIEDIERGFSYIKKENPKVLEIGCGNGRDAKEILKFTSDYLGIDISSELIKIAKKNIPEGNFEIADVENFIFPKKIDIIFSFASLLHSDKNKVQDILNRASNALNERGIFYISLKYGDYREATKKYKEFGVKTFYFYTPELMEEMARNNYEKIYTDTQELRGEKWFTIILRKY